MKRAIVGLAALFVMGMLAQPATADSVVEDFTGWAPGPPLTVQDGWKFEGAGKYDIGMFSNIQGNAVRISNGIMSGSFGDWLFSPALDDASDRDRRTRSSWRSSTSSRGAERAAAGSADSRSRRSRLMGLA